MRSRPLRPPAHSTAQHSTALRGSALRSLVRGCPGARPNHAFLEHCCAVIEQGCCPRAFLIQRCDAYVTIAAHLEDVVEKPVGVKVVGVDRELVQVALAQFGEVVEAAPKAAAQVSLHERVDDDQELRPINASSAPAFVRSMRASHEASAAGAQQGAQQDEYSGRPSLEFNFSQTATDRDDQYLYLMAMAMMAIVVAR